MSALFASSAPAQDLPWIYQVQSAKCVVPVSFRGQNGHTLKSAGRPFLSFGEFALEREEAGAPPAVGMAHVLTDLILVHFAGDCENRMKWAQELVDDYHRRFPGDAVLAVAFDRGIPGNYLALGYFHRVKPKYRYGECMATLRVKPREGYRAGEAFGDLLSAQRDLYVLSGSRNPGYVIDRPDDENRVTLVFTDLCEERYERAKALAERFAEINDGTAAIDALPVNGEVADAGSGKATPYFRDTREILLNYIPPGPGPNRSK